MWAIIYLLTHYAATKDFFAKRRDLKYWENIRMDPRANNGAVGGANEDGKPIGGINRDSMVC